VVRLNGEIQGDDKFQVKKNQIFINSCPNTNPSQKCLTVEISKKCILETIKKNKNPFAGLEESERLKIEIPYVKYSEYKTFFQTIYIYYDFYFRQRAT
jgi:hypothetical protein